MKHFLFLILLWGASLFGQYEEIVRHHSPLVISDTLSSNTTVKTLWVQFAGKGIEGLIDSLASGETLTAAGWDTSRSANFAGYLTMDVILTNIDYSALDSMKAVVYPIDKYGTAISNDSTYAWFTTPPAYTAFDSLAVRSWASGVLYRANLAGAFGYATWGLKIRLYVYDETADKKLVFVVRVYYN